jgi:sugar O-acyltransferase (sialic acid O-acetyltransferase NeuD family)
MDLARGIKHGLDRVAAGALLVLLSPLLGLIALAIRADSPGGPFFLQERIGAGGRTFTIFKFRTMRHASAHEGLGHATASDDDRITRVGAWLRAMSLDELPQLLNIVLGEMSFVGPRPTLRYQVEHYTQKQRRRLLFRPGITGWAQVHGRNEIPWAQRIEYDLEYVDRYSLWLDLRILLRTIAVLLRRDGVYAAQANDTFVAPPRAPEVAGALGAGNDGGAARAGAAAPAEQCPESPQGTRVASVEAEPPAPAPASAPAPVPATAGDAGSAPVALLPLVVVGAGGHARVLVDIVEKQARYRVVGLIDERPNLRGTSVLGYPVLGGREVLDRSDAPAHAIVAIGAAAPRAAWQEHLEARGFQLAVLVHPGAHVGRDVRLGGGTTLMAGAIVNSGSRLGRGVIVNTGASIDHDCEIGEFVHVAPGARLAGGVRVGDRAHVGIGACVIQNLRVGAGAVIGAGAAVVRDVAPASTVVGVPARPLPARAGTATEPAPA